VDVVAAGAGKQLLARKTMSDMMSESLLFQEGDEFVLKKRPLPHIPVAYAHQMVIDASLRFSRTPKNNLTWISFICIYSSVCARVCVCACVRVCVCACVCVLQP